MKDTNNLIPYNIWSCSEYENNINGIMPNDLKIHPSSNFSTIGEQSLKINYNGGNNWLNIDISQLITSNSLYTVELDVYSPESNGSITLREYNSTTVIAFSQQETIQTISLTKSFSQVSGTYVQILCRENYFFVDNISLKKN